MGFLTIIITLLILILGKILYNDFLIFRGIFRILSGVFLYVVLQVTEESLYDDPNLANKLPSFLLILVYYNIKFWILISYVIWGGLTFYKGVIQYKIKK